MRQRIYNLNGRSGLVAQRPARRTGTVVSLYHTLQAGIDSGPDDMPWATVCENHNATVCHKTLADARSWMSAPDGWCNDCCRRLVAATQPTAEIFYPRYDRPYHGIKLGESVLQVYPDRRVGVVRSLRHTPPAPPNTVKWYSCFIEWCDGGCDWRASHDLLRLRLALRHVPEPT